MTIYDGTSTSAPLLRDLCGSSLPGDVVSSGNTMYIRFGTNNVDTYSGFRIQYTAIDANCPNGTEYNTTSSSCQMCSRGAYRAKNVNDMCAHCPEERTTATSGAYTREQCNIADCTKGQHYKDSTKQQCSPCKRGFYQDMPWQDSCVKCPDSMTTIATGSKSATDCKLNCDSGWQLNETTEQCELCPRGFYRDKKQTFYCQMCPRHLITPGTGATAESDCFQGNCTAGHMIQGKTCKACPLGTYQDEKWQTECKRCGDKMTTNIVTATDSCHNGENNCTTHVNGGTCTLVGDGPDYTCGCREGWILNPDATCTRNCDSGWQLRKSTGECVLCPRGFYRDKVQHVYCQMCPRHLITPGRGSTVESDCLQGNCTAGQMIEGKTCKACPLGTYQDKKWQTKCNRCEDKKTTSKEGATTEDDCFSTDSCDNGENDCTPYDNGGTCTLTSLYVIGGGAGGSVLLLLGVILVVVCFVIRRRTTDSTAESNFPPAFQNEAYEPSAEPQDQTFDEPDYQTLNRATMDRRHRT
ncbi:hypothetical protein NP493_1280g00020 [Ridgeia piscesae]|uniref:CUB domain-containing protein n=1 Tax=Ridgeia piscesae TaxID=27915 RepID=A0AAD9NER1_RIDPI|nr:hypothetical protein NP493_1280g00020 [Ridgeia piscesae]